MTTPENTALTFLQQHQAEHLAGDEDALIARCAQHLQDMHDMARERASTLARELLAQVQGNAGGYIDTLQTSAHLLVLSDTANGTRHTITAAELLRYARNRPAQGTTTHVRRNWPDLGDLIDHAFKPR